MSFKRTVHITKTLNPVTEFVAAELNRSSKFIREVIRSVTLPFNNNYQFSYLLQEDGFFLLQEDGFKIIL